MPRCAPACSPTAARHEPAARFRQRPPTRAPRKHLLHRKLLRIMIVLGIVLLIAGFVFKISLLWTLGVVLVVIGLVLTLLGSFGHAVGGRRTYF